ncbi:hypothetical protein [Ralstonia pseudosolanacearum]|uniref:hypothetical protein n=1 Tax=Ralstonia pseudosolanacearum TaxID=1310165 RepID=UPI0012EE3185|nr:hypothetical protein [Ralstonia pseudosolanacearum]MCK4155040.1 hypothetical protein [Ralstonia pseudosolanacearum]MCQ4678401.1 hypothetical protein [Ralstonia pseudosolanacearum]MDC6283112.1 hypothetical protein [Ralstonia pseudosolanacearum]
MAPKAILREEAEAPPLATLTGIDDATTDWPASLAHLALSYDNVGSDFVVIAEISEAPVAGVVGYWAVSVALVPHALVDKYSVRMKKAQRLEENQIRSHSSEEMPLPLLPCN